MQCTRFCSGANFRSNSKTYPKKKMAESLAAHPLLYWRQLPQPSSNDPLID